MDDRERGLAFLFAITLPPMMVWFLVAKFTYGIDASTAQPSVIHTTTSKADSRPRRRSSVARVRSPKTCATTVLRILSYA